ncbi:hypothetical protein VKT23_015567 [Stygiomarasmius scandens]|uniref:Maturase K n=1 Tax=Marasmiellus scandens TaxID=2682957 RepID=A0ABR1IZU6_9AGAR
MVQEKYALHNCFSHIAHEQVTPDLLHELEDFNFWSYFDLLHRDIIAQRHDEADQWPFLLTWRTEVQSCFRFFQDHPSKTQDHLLNSLNHGFYVTEVAPTHIRISEQLEALLAFSESDIPLLQKLGIIHDSELAELVFMMRISKDTIRWQGHASRFWVMGVPHCIEISMFIPIPWNIVLCMWLKLLTQLIL